MTKPPKLTRAQIKEGLKTVPIEQVLLGATSPAGIKLTGKQKAFAKKVAEGIPKAQAYRESYNTKADKQTQANEGYKLAKRPEIATMIDAFTLANEAREYLLPDQMRTLAIQKLVEITTTDGEKTANKLKAIELIGKMHEVSLFNETKTHLHIHSSTDLKAKLLDGLRLAFTSSRSLNDDAKRKAESLLAELNSPLTIDGDAIEIIESETPPTPTPLEMTESHSQTLHSIPDNQTTPLTNSGSPTDPDDVHSSDARVTNPLESTTSACISINPNTETQGEGDANSLLEDLGMASETPPLSKS
jgi:hypothetical protein